MPDLSILSMATVVSPVQQRERTVQAANITERENNMYLSSRTRIDIIDKCGKALVLFAPGLSMTGALSISTLSTTALPGGVHEARHLGLPALLLAFPRFELPRHCRRNVPFSVLRAGLLGNQPSAGDQGRYSSVDVACALTAHAGDITRQVPRGDHLHSACRD